MFSAPEGAIRFVLRRDRFGRLPTRFFAEAGEFLFVEAFVVFLEDLLGPGQILFLDEYVASAAERNSRTSGDLRPLFAPNESARSPSLIASEADLLPEVDPEARDHMGTAVPWFW
jgi:hypothetical protein